MTSFENIMTQEQKELLLKDLCSRLPYGVKISVNDKVETLQGIDILDNVVEYDSFLSSDIEEVRPYLFPMSNMTEEQDKEFALLQTSPGQEGFLYTWNCANMMKWLIENNFDYNGLIPMGLAKDATNLNIY